MTNSPNTDPFDPSQTKRVVTLIDRFVWAWPGGGHVFEDRLYALLKKRDSDSDLIDFFVSRLPVYAHANQSPAAAHYLIRLVEDLADPRLLDVILPYLHHPRPTTRYKTVMALSKFTLTPTRLAELLEPLLADRYLNVRGAAIQVLGQSTDPAVLRMVLQNVLPSTNHRELEILENILRQTGRTNPKLLGEVLIQVLQTEETSEQGLTICLQVLYDLGVRRDILVCLQPFLRSLLYTTSS
ncbi:MAG: HEAT repeat domain-containing protein [Candidatus Hodarchaeota archaeon]